MYQCTRFHMEIPMFLIAFAFMFESTITGNLIMYRTCTVILGYNETECAALGTGQDDEHTDKLETAAQPHTSIILMVLSILDTILPSITCIFLGPWTDKYGRKPVLVYGIAGYSLYYIILLIISMFPKASPWYFATAHIPVCLTGGFTSVYSAMLCYVSDITSNEKRGFRLGLLEGVLATGTFVGGIASTFVLEATNYVVVYAISAGCITCAWIFVFLLIPESVKKYDNEEKAVNLFNPSLLKQALSDTFKKRKYNGRSLIIILITVKIVFYLSYEAEYYVVFLFVREKFHWSITQFAIYNSSNTILWIVGNVFGTYVLHHLLHLDEIYLVLLGILSGIAGSIWQAVATKDWHIYGGGASKWLGGAVSPMALSLLSKTVTEDEYGNVMSIITALDSLGYLAVLPFFTWVYNSTLLTHPEAFNYVSAGMCSIAVVLVIVAIVIYKKKKIKNKIDENANEKAIHVYTVTPE